LFKDETLYNNANHMLEDSRAVESISENPRSISHQIAHFLRAGGLQFRNINGGAGENQVLVARDDNTG